MAREGGLVTSDSRTVHYCRLPSSGPRHRPLCDVKRPIRLHLRALRRGQILCVNCRLLDLRSKSEV